MAYVDYTYYKETFKGSSIPEAAFDGWEVQAEAYIDMITFGRIDADNVSNEVKKAVCAVSEKAKQLHDDGGIKTSETVGNHSVAYKIEDSASTMSKLKVAASVHLCNTGLLYRGR